MTNKTAVEFKFDLFGDYKKQFAEYVNSLYSTGLELSVNERNLLVETLTEAYITSTGERPETKQLERLGSWIMLETYADKNPYKRNQENPVLSKKQVINRRMNERRYFDESAYE